MVTMVSASCGGLYGDGESDSDADELTDVDCCRYDEIVEGETRRLSVRLRPGSAGASPTLLGCFLRRTKTLTITILYGLVAWVQYQRKSRMILSLVKNRRDRLRSVGLRRDGAVGTGSHWQPLEGNTL